MTKEELLQFVADTEAARADIDEFEPTQEHYLQAMDWLLKLRERDQQTCPEFEAWKSHAAHEFAFNDIEKLFIQAAQPAQNLQYFRRSHRGYFASLRSWRNAGLAIAACLTLAFLSPMVDSLAFLGADAATRTGQMKIVTLKDGTRVTLNTRSAIDADIGTTRRSVTLRDGEAYFEVARDVSRPFYIRAGNANVRVLGTKFNVRIEGDQTRVSVTSGKVRVATHDHDDQPVFLTDSEEALVTAKAVQKQRALTHADSWRTHRISFADTPLRIVVRDLNRYRNHSIYITNAALGNNLVNGVFDTNDPDECVRIIEQTIGLSSITLPTGQTFLY
jgi:transmembrane sensor